MKRKRQKRADVRHSRNIVYLVTALMVLFYSVVGFATTTPHDTFARAFVAVSQVSVVVAALVGLRWRRVGAGLMLASALAQSAVLAGAMMRFEDIPLWGVLLGVLCYTLPYWSIGALQWRLSSALPPPDDHDHDALQDKELRLALEQDPDYNNAQDGDLVEWLGTGLQNRLRRFESGSRLKEIPS